MIISRAAVQAALFAFMLSKVNVFFCICFVNKTLYLLPMFIFFVIICVLIRVVL